VSTELSLFQQQHSLAFRDPDLLQTAFVHSSYVNESDDADLSDNERLEFLGDSILGYAVSELLYARFPDMSEGQLTSVRASLVRRETLARFARQLRLGDYLLLGHGEDESGGRKRAATLCATFEAVVGAIYLDLGIEAVRRFVLPLVESDLARIQPHTLGKDPKSRFQEWTQRTMGLAPRYRVVADDGPDHAKVFTTQVSVGDRRYGVGRGRSKQEASQSAAAMALYVLGMGAPEYQPDPETERMWPIDSGDAPRDGLDGGVQPIA
jgi:ribonuclease-3